MKEALATAGLGEKSLSIPMAGTPSDLHQYLLRLYPPLAECGGYTLLKCAANSKSLQIVQPPPGGHSAVSLAAVVGQSRVYIRPLQKDIPLLQQSQSQQVAANNFFYIHYVYIHAHMHTMSYNVYTKNFLLQTADGPKETCLNCNEMFDLATLPIHLRSCQGTSRAQAIDVPDDDNLEDFEPVRVRFRIPGLSTNHPSRTVVRFPLCSLFFGRV